MEKENIEKILNSVHSAMKSLLEVACLKPKQIIIVGCSTSEVVGERIGSAGNEQVAEAIWQGIKPLADAEQLFLAVQCCEHLNRSLVIEEDCLSYYGLDQVNAVPQKKAGGAFATFAYQKFSAPVLVETVKAHGGIDIGDTLIGMHLKQVAIPVRCSIKKVGRAHLVMARTRDKYIGGERAKYRQ